MLDTGLRCPATIATCVAARPKNRGLRLPHRRHVHRRGSTNYAYDNADELTSRGSTTYTYDHDGNELSAGGTTFSYDLASRLTGVTAGGSTTTYAYDGDGNRSRATSGSAVTMYLWDPRVLAGVRS